MKSFRIYQKRHMQRKRIEIIKSALIFILLFIFIFQIFLLIRTQSISGLLSQYSSEGEIILSDDDVTNLYFEYTAPDYIIANRGQNRNVYFNDSKIYQNAQLILEEINRSIFMPDVKVEAAPAGLFEELTSRNCLYISYPSRRYPKYSAQFLNSSQENISPYISSYTKLILLPDTEEDSEHITAYIKDDKTGASVKINTSVASSSLINFLDNIEDLERKDYSFAHELNQVELNEESLSNVRLNGDILIPLTPLSFPAVSVSVPHEFNNINEDGGASYAAEEIMQTFGFTPSTARRYADSGVLVCVDEKATLKLYSNGIIEYNSVNKESGLNLTGSSRLTNDNSYFLSFTGISRIINSVISFSGNTENAFKIRLTELQSESVDVSQYKFMFDFFVNGLRVTSTPYHWIEATAIDGKLTSMRIDLKRFESTDEIIETETIVSALNRFKTERSGNTEVFVQDAYLAYPYKNDASNLSPSWTVF